MDKLDAALADVVTRLSELTAEHGDKAVDLALLAYQVEAIRALLFPAALAAALIIFGRWIVSASRRNKAILDGNENPPYVLCAAAGWIVVAVSAIPIFAGLLDPVRWLAAFGHPELMLATKALNAAGLL